jgi:Uma2 family endonuclease
MNPPVRRHGLFRFDEFCCLTGERKGDLIDGVIFLDPPETPASNELWNWIINRLKLLTDQFEAGRVFGPKVAFRLDDRNAVEPDIAFLSARRRNRIRRDYVIGPPDAAFEIVAPESSRRDYVLKRRLYELAGVSEYWIIDAAFRAVTLYQRSPHGRLRKRRARQGRYQSQVIRDFDFSNEWFSDDRRTRLIWEHGELGYDPPLN